METTEFTLHDYWRIIRKHKWLINAVFCIVMLSTVIFTALQIPIYNSSIEIKIEKPPTFASIPTGGDTLATAAFQSTNLATDLRLITSLPVVSQVVEMLEVLPSNPTERENALHTLAMNYQSRIFPEQIANTDIIKITVESNSPDKAALTATAIADVYVAKNMETRRKQTQALLEYITKEMDIYKQRLAEEESALQKFNQNEKVFEVTPEIKKTLDRLSISGTFEFEHEMLRINANLNKLQQVIDGNNKIKELDDLIKAETPETYMLVGLKRRLLELEFERFLLLIDYTEDHPSVVDKDVVITGVKNKIVQIIKDFSTIEITPDVESDLALLLKELFLASQREVLYRIVNRFYGDSGSLSSNQLEYVRLKRNVENYLQSFEDLSRQLEKVKIEQAKIIDDVVSIVSPAIKPKRPIKPDARMNYSISAVLGILLGLLACFIKESMDRSVSNITDIKEELKMSVLGIIPHIRKEDVVFSEEQWMTEKDKKIALQKARLVTITNPKSWAAESIKMLRTNLIRISKDQNINTFLFTSSDKQEGKTTTVTNIAVSLAQLGKKTILVGCNLRRPTIYKIFGLNREPGVSDILMGHISWQAALKSSVDILTGGLNVDDLLSIPGIDNLKIITAGRPVENVSELLDSKAFDALIADLKRNFDIVILDCSPVMAVPDAITLCDKVESVVLIYKVGQTPKDVLKMAKNNLVNAKANLLGVVLNDIKSEAQVGYSAYYYRYYSDQPERKRKKSKSPIQPDTVQMENPLID